MKLLKKIEDIKFTRDFCDIPHFEGVVSEPLVMASAAGWYIGTVCKDDEMPDLVQPYDRWTGYMTKEQAIETLKEEWFIY
tara:strand:+ start:361 stop:600 length:240 start_codon:yes stop_codon:yes gene_type:complete